MIIEARNDVVSLRGTLSENHWDAIAAAVDLLLPDHPRGILMDCSGLVSMTDTGGATFLDALSDLEARGARIILCDVPPSLQEQLRQIPGLHSQVPIAPTLQLGRQSLDAGGSTPLTAVTSGRVVVVPVNPPFSAAAVRETLSRLQLGITSEVHFVYAMVVPRSLPVGAPLPDEEARADSALLEAESLIPASIHRRHVLRGRQVTDGIVEAVNKLHASEVIAGLASSSSDQEDTTPILESLRQKCPCDLIVALERSSSRK